MNGASVNERLICKLHAGSHGPSCVTSLQEERLRILQQFLEQRETANDKLVMQRLEAIWQRKLQEDEMLTERIQRKRAKSTCCPGVCAETTQDYRKLLDERKKADKQHHSRNIIGEYANFNSKVYAPQAIDGAFHDPQRIRTSIKPAELVRYEALKELEQALPHTLLQANVKPPVHDRNQKHLTPAKRRAIHEEELLIAMDKSLQVRSFSLV